MSAILSVPLSDAVLMTIRQQPNGMMLANHDQGRHDYIEYWSLFCVLQDKEQSQHAAFPVPLALGMVLWKS